ncbi:hypothetical protein BP5796_09379 [Coleophoma crateriformis]|uniref:Transcription factor domain-containing protein n=1 Tax=Coleophoma crateriformis TaxID=565419 RepID=A0A3D8QY61_9HELO|nr:hypothetical protein BP5796_09379 [Coleophoma crateriformis]
MDSWKHQKLHLNPSYCQSFRSQKKPLLFYNNPTTPLESQVVCFFIDNFVLKPTVGSSRSFMEFILPALLNETSLSSTSSPLASAVFAVALAFFGNCKSKSLRSTASKHYVTAIHQLNKALQDPDRAFEDETLAAILMMALFEVITGSAAQPNGWNSHANGASALVQMREQKKSLSPFGRILHVMARGQMTVNCLMTSTSPQLGVDWWMQFGSKDDLPALVARFSLEVAQVHADVCHIFSSAKGVDYDRSDVMQLLDAAQALELEFTKWEESLTSIWRFNTVAWIDRSEVEDLETSNVFPGKVDEYVDISIAMAWNSMRASRIMLCGDIIRCTAWLHSPALDYQVAPECSTAIQHSKEMIEDIIASVPLFLGYGSRSGSLGDWGSSLQSLHQKSAMGLFITWPLFITTVSDFSTDEQKLWSRRRLHYLATEKGIHQASLYSALDIGLPSLLIDRDRNSEAVGRDLANSQCLETVMKGLDVKQQSKTVQIVIRDLLGLR